MIELKFIIIGKYEANILKTWKKKTFKALYNFPVSCQRDFNFIFKHEKILKIRYSKFKTDLKLILSYLKL